MRLLPLLYGLFCLVVLSGYTYTKVQGLSLFSSGLIPSGSRTSSGGGHGTGVFLGSHK
jgi:hypothetical protein